MRRGVRLCAMRRRRCLASKMGRRPAPTHTAPRTSAGVLKGAVRDGAHDLWLEHEVTEARAVQAHVLVLAALCRAARRAALGGARALVHLLRVLIVQQRLLSLLWLCGVCVSVGGCAQAAGEQARW